MLKKDGLVNNFSIIALIARSHSKQLRFFQRLMLGFMIVTAFISMWITNTATTAMMTPIMEAVLKKLDDELDTKNRSSNFDSLAVITSNEPPQTGDETRSSPSDATEETHLEAERGEEEMIEMASPSKTYRQDSGDIDG